MAGGRSTADPDWLFDQLRQDHNICRWKIATVESLLAMGRDAWPLLRDACQVLEDVVQAHTNREAALITAPGALSLMRSSRVALGHHEALFSLRVLNRFVLEADTANMAECRKAITTILSELRTGMQAQDAGLFPRSGPGAPLWLQAQSAA